MQGRRRSSSSKRKTGGSSTSAFCVIFDVIMTSFVAGTGVTVTYVSIFLDLQCDVIICWNLELQ